MWDVSLARLLQAHQRGRLTPQVQVVQVCPFSKGSCILAVAHTHIPSLLILNRGLASNIPSLQACCAPSQAAQYSSGGPSPPYVSAQDADQLKRHTHTHTHTRAHTHTCTHTHAFIHPQRNIIALNSCLPLALCTLVRLLQCTYVPNQGLVS